MASKEQEQKSICSELAFEMVLSKSNNLAKRKAKNLTLYSQRQNLRLGDLTWNAFFSRKFSFRNATWPNIC